MNFRTGEELLELCKENNISISEAMFKREQTIFNMDECVINKQIEHAYDIMKNAVKRALGEELKSMGGLVGGESKKIYNNRNKSVCGELMSRAVSYAMGVLEVNASMGLIVAAPTAGSSGVLPGVLVALQEDNEWDDKIVHKGLLNAGAIGYLITRNATVSGAEGGCQAEVGAASAMAASAIVELFGGSPEQCLDAASTALTNILGLVCDPIAGLVEAPCQKRNGMGASNAMISAEMTLAGVRHIVPFDETVEAMYKVGRSMPIELRETALGGIAAAPTACQLCSEIFKKNV
ncbi:MAG: L-serine ammonia-lyase, iron-sulfur-dependent, subunit alpha [Cellulosilyticaceae bacterium]